MNSNNSGFFSSIPIITKNLIIINVLFLLADFLLAKNGIDLSQYLGLNYIQSEHFMPHQFFTYMFMHGNFQHLFFNMFAVFMFGRTLETVWGPKRFLVYYILTGLFAGIVQEITWVIEYREIIFNPEISSIRFLDGLTIDRQTLFNGLITVGASGCVFGILLAFGMLFPNAELFIIPFPFPIKAKWFVIGYGVIELSLGVANRQGDNIAHFAHLGGLVAGFFIILYWKRKAKANGTFF